MFNVNMNSRDRLIVVFMNLFWWSPFNNSYIPYITCKFCYRSLSLQKKNKEINNKALQILSYTWDHTEEEQMAVFFFVTVSQDTDAFPVA